VGHFSPGLDTLRTTYLDDRAYRLLIAVVDDGSVRPIDPAVRDQFLAEAKLGRLPLKDGFEYLASLEPRLHDLPPRRLADLRQKQSGFTSRRSEPRLVGAWAEGSYPVLNTDLAASVVKTYLAVKGAGRDVDHDATPFFERRQRTRTRSFALFGRGDTRPRAQN
jgi:hypothetical protein